MEEIDRFDWVDDSLFGEAACVTFVEGMDLAAVAEAFGGSLDEAVMKDFDVDDYDPEFETAWVALRQVGDWVLALEDNGYQGRRTEVLRRLTGGRAVSCFWNVNGVNDFSYVEGGTVMTSFEPGFEGRSGVQPDVLEPFTAGLLPEDDDIDDYIPGTELMLALAARITGVVLTPEMLSGQMPVVYLLPWAQDVRDEVYPRFEPLTHDDPVLAYALLRADDAALLRVARLAVEQAAIVAGIDGEAEIMAVVDGFASPGDFLVLDQLARDLEPQDRWPRFRAVEAARACSSPSALAAAYQAITSARYALQAARQGDAGSLRERLLEELGSPPAPSGSGDLRGDDWLDEHWLGLAGCVTLRRGPGEFEFGSGEPVTGPVALTTEPMAWERTFGEWTVVVEPGSPVRNADQLLGRISAGGEAVLVEWSARGNVLFWHAVDGTVRTNFNGYAPEQVWGTEPHALDELRAGLPIPRPNADGGGQAAGLLALAARLTGVELTAASLDEQWVGRKVS